MSFTSTSVHLFLAIATAVAISRVSSETLYIVTSSNSPCPGSALGEPCLTLQQYAANPSRDTNVTLELEAGQHNFLSGTLEISNIEALRIIANEATIMCTQYGSYININSVQNVQMSGATFFNCSMAVRDSHTFVLEDSRVLYSTLSIESLRNATIRDSYVSFNGQYSLRVAQSSSVVIERCTFADTIVTGSPGGSIWGSRSNITIINSSFSNISGIANALYVERSESYILIINSTFTANKIASYGFFVTGGIVNVQSGSIAVYGSNFTNNSVSGSGGVFSATSVNLFVSDSVFIKNSAGVNGGVVYISGASSYSSYSSQKTSVSIDRSSFISNFANESGGVMHVSVDAVSVGHSYFFNNTARFGGGGVLFLEKQSSNASFSDSAFSNNSAAYCGVLEADTQYNYTVTISRGFFENNRAIGQSSGRNEGGVACTRNASVLVQYSTFTNNYATGDAGIAYVDESTITARSSIFHGNMASRNGGVFVNQIYPTRYIMDTSRFSLNHASRDGGVFYAGRAGSQVNITSSEFEFNNARNRGGVAVALGSYVFINGTSIVNSTAYWGGVLRACNSEVVSPDLDLFVGIDPTNSLCDLYYESYTNIPQEDMRESATTTESNDIITNAAHTPYTASSSDSSSGTAVYTVGVVPTRNPVTDDTTQPGTGVPSHTTRSSDSYPIAIVSPTMSMGGRSIGDITTNAATTTQADREGIEKLEGEGVRWQSVAVLSLCVSLIVLVLVAVLYVGLAVYVARRKVQHTHSGCCSCEKKEGKDDMSQMTNLLSEKETIP